MGRGVAYPHSHHVIVDYYALTEQLDDNGNDVEPDEYDQDQSADDWNHFKEQVMLCFGAWEIYHKSEGRERYLFAETDRLYIGIDYSGADSAPCIYLKPKTWETTRTKRNGMWMYYDVTEHEYNINRDAERGFNKLIKLYGNLIEYWTSGYTTSTYGPQKDGSYKSYNRKS